MANTSDFKFTSDIESIRAFSAETSSSISSVCCGNVRGMAFMNHDFNVCTPPRSIMIRIMNDTMPVFIRYVKSFPMPGDSQSNNDLSAGMARPWPILKRAMFINADRTAKIGYASTVYLIYMGNIDFFDCESGVKFDPTSDIANTTTEMKTKFMCQKKSKIQNPKSKQKGKETEICRFKFAHSLLN